MSNVIKYGISEVYYSLILNGRTYDTPVAMPNCVSISLSPIGSIIPVYGSNQEAFSLEVRNGYDGSLEFLLIPDDFRINILGDTIVNGIQVEANSAVSKEFGLTFVFEGDVKKRKHVLYRCKATRPNIESGTVQGEKVDLKNETLSLTVRPRLSDSLTKAKTTDTTPDAVYNNWSTMIWEPTGIYTIGALSVLSGEGTITGDTIITVTPAITVGNTYAYKAGASVTLPVLGQICTTGYTAWDGTDELTLTAGQTIVIVEINANSKAVKAGSDIITVKTA